MMCQYWDIEITVDKIIVFSQAFDLIIEHQIAKLTHLFYSTGL